jgi:hypothetical protein
MVDQEGFNPIKGKPVWDSARPEPPFEAFVSEIFAPLNPLGMRNEPRGFFAQLKQRDVCNSEVGSSVNRKGIKNEGN